jgi:hypothetical protein
VAAWAASCAEQPAFDGGAGGGPGDWMAAVVALGGLGRAGDPPAEGGTGL